MSASPPPEGWAHWLTQRVSDAMYGVYVAGDRALGFGWSEAGRLIEELRSRGIELVSVDVNRKDRDERD